jgi:hypothetical protein
VRAAATFRRILVKLNYVFAYQNVLFL